VKLVETILISNVVGEEDTVGATVKQISYGSVLFIASSIPYLYFYDLIFNIHPKVAKIHSDRYFVILDMDAIYYAFHEAGFANVRLSDYNQLKQMVVMWS